MKRTATPAVSSTRTTLTLALAALLLWLPLSAHADQFSFLRLDATPDLVSTAAQRDARRSLVVALNRSGNLVLQHAGISVTMARQPFADDPTMRDIMKRLHLQVNPTSGGVRVKVAYSF